MNYQLHASAAHWAKDWAVRKVLTLVFNERCQDMVINHILTGVALLSYPAQIITEIQVLHVPCSKYPELSTGTEETHGTPSILNVPKTRRQVFHQSSWFWMLVWAVQKAELIWSKLVTAKIGNVAAVTYFTLPSRYPPTNEDNHTVVSTEICIT